MKVLNWVFSVGERLPCTLQGVAQHPWTLASPITAMMRGTLPCSPYKTGAHGVVTAFVLREESESQNC